MKLLYVMDPMTRILPDKDTSYAIQRAAQNLGYSALHTMAHELTVCEGKLWARCREIRVLSEAPWFALGQDQDLSLSDVDAVLIRKDPPFDRSYLYLTLMLSIAQKQTRVINDPRGLRDANEKLYALNFAEHMPPTLVSASRDEIMRFVGEQGGRGVIKPLDGAGGSGVLMVDAADKNCRSIIDMLTHEGTHTVMVQGFLPAVTAGDKRVLILDGEVLGAINRVPRGDDLRSNIHAGGSVEPTTLTTAERALVDSVLPKLKADGLFFVGLDLIGGRLTEVNVTSPTGIQELSRFEGKDRAEDVVRWLERGGGKR